MRFGIILIPGAPWDRHLEDVLTYEAIGFDVIATGDHMRHPFDPQFEFLDGWSVLPAWAAATTRPRLSMLVTNAIYRNPMLLVRQAIAVDHISGGRLEVGVGTGIFDTDHAMAGVPSWTPSERIARTREFLEAYLALFAGQPSFEGRWYRFSDTAIAPGPLQTPRPPLIVGANGPKAIDLAARFGDGWNTWGGYGINEAEFFRLAEERSHTFTERCRAHGRDPSAPMRSILIHHGAVDPWTSREKFSEIVERCKAYGFYDLVFYEPKEERRDAFRDIVENVMPEARG